MAAEYSKEREARERAEQKAKDEAERAALQAQMDKIPDSAFDEEAGVVEIRAQIRSATEALKAVTKTRAALAGREEVPRQIAALGAQISDMKERAEALAHQAIEAGDLEMEDAVAARAQLRALEDRHAAMLSGWRRFVAQLPSEATDEEVAELQRQLEDAEGRLARRLAMLKRDQVRPSVDRALLLERMGLARTGSTVVGRSKNEAGNRRAERRAAAAAAGVVVQTAGSSLEA